MNWQGVNFQSSDHLFSTIIVIYQASFGSALRVLPFALSLPYAH